MVTKCLKIPWRVRYLISEHFPLFYHFVANLGEDRKDERFWDEAFRISWQAGSRDWPTKSRLIQSLTSPSDTILDVGCGTGSILRYLMSCGYTDLHGMEVSQAAVETLSGVGIRMTKGRLPWIPLPDNTFDVVIASQVLEHIVRRGKLVKEIARVLKPGGRLLVFVPDECLGPIDEPSHVIKYTLDKLQSFLSKYFASVEVRRFRDENFTMPILFASAVSEVSPANSEAESPSPR